MVSNWKSQAIRNGVPLRVSASTSEGRNLFEFDYNYSAIPQNPIRLTTQEKENLDALVNILDRIGVKDLITQFIPAHSGGSSQEAPLRDRDVRWLFWLKSIIGSGKTKVLLIPDTNFIKRHYGSRRLIPMMHDRLVSPPLEIQIKISRLVAFELEHQLNRLKQDRDLRKRRLGYSDYYELMYLRQEGAQLLPELEDDMIRDFSRIAGQQYADPMIRKEIRVFISRSNLSQDTAFLFLTCDVTNSLAAANEGMPTILFSRSSQDYFVLQYPHEPADLLIDAAITFGEIRVKRDQGTKSEEFVLQGDWSAKTNSDWEDNCVRQMP